MRPRRYVIVGSGAAGAILAARLSEQPHHHVVLLEAGPDFPDVRHFPDDIKYAWGTPAGIISINRPDRDWMYVATTGQNTTTPLPRGKIIGGSTSINSCVFLRGIPDDFARWVAMGCDAWSWEQVLPFYRMLESDLDFGNEPYHGATGPVKVWRSPRSQWRPDMVAWHDACIGQGFPYCADANKPGATGVSPYPLNIHHRVRQSTAIAYLVEARQRHNLDIRGDCQVTRVLFDAARRATGVQVSDGSVISADEVVLSAGAIGTPQLLLLSGVGPQTALEAMGIPIVVDSPCVGSNLRDHAGAPIDFELHPHARVDTDTMTYPQQIGLRYTAAESPFANDMIVFVGAGEKVATGRHGGQKLFYVRPMVNLAVSAGRLSLASTDPHVPPKIDLNLCAAPLDRRRMREAIRLCLRITAHAAFSCLGILRQRLVPTDADLASDDSLDAFILREVTTGHHACGTARMGVAGDPAAVVDQQGRVFGVAGLRVCDASIMPDCVRANIGATVMMLAERIAHGIEQERGTRSE